jgi:hypothetical protein
MPPLLSAGAIANVAATATAAPVPSAVIAAAAAAVSVAAVSVAAVSAAATIAVSADIAAAFWLIVVCPRLPLFRSPSPP